MGKCGEWVLEITNNQPLTNVQRCHGTSVQLPTTYNELITIIQTIENKGSAQARQVLFPNQN